MRFLLPLFMLFSLSSSAQKELEHFLVINPKGHKSQIFDMSFDPHGKIVTGSFDKHVYVWDSKKAAIEKDFIGQIGPGAEGMVYTCDVSPNGKYLAVGGWMGKDDESENIGDIRIYNYQTGKMRKRLKWHENAILSLRFTPDSKHLIAGDASGNIVRWNMSTMWYDHLYTQVNYGLNNIAVTDDYFISSHEDGMVYKWEYDKFKPAKKLNFFKKTSTGMVVQSEVAISPNGELVAVAGKELGMMLVLNSKLSLKQHFFTGDNSIVSFAFAPSSERLAISLKQHGKNLIKIYDLIDDEWAEIGLQRFDDLIGSLMFEDENTLISAGGRLNSIYVHELKEGNFKEKKIMHGEGRNYYSAGINKMNLHFQTNQTKRMEEVNTRMSLICLTES